MFFIKLHVYTCLIKYCLCSLFPSFVRNFLCRGTTQDEVMLHIIITCACVLFYFMLLFLPHKICTYCVLYVYVMVQFYAWCMNLLEY